MLRIRLHFEMDSFHLGSQNTSDRRRQEFGSGVVGPEAGEFLKIGKIYRRKFEKCICSLFLKNVYKPRRYFSGVSMKNQKWPEKFENW